MKNIISLILLISLADSFVINKNKAKISSTNINRSKRDSIGQNRLLNSRDRHYQALYVDSKKRGSIDSKIASFYLQNAENLDRDFLQKFVKQFGKKQTTNGRGRRLRNFRNHFSRRYNPWSEFIWPFSSEIFQTSQICLKLKAWSIGYFCKNLFIKVCYSWSLRNLS